MSFYDKFYFKMPDGTIKQINPFNGTEVWCVEERKRGPAITPGPEKEIPFVRKSLEDYCHFCEANYFYCTPEKARVYKNSKGNWKKEYHVLPDDWDKSKAEFRRLGNLFEIVTYDYWTKNYHYEMNKKNRKWRESYLSSARGLEHIMNVLQIKMKRIGLNLKKFSKEERIEKADPFFGGCHELIIGKRHYKEGASFEHESCSSGELTIEEHYQYIKFTVESLVDIFEQNPFVRYISVFQNWLRPAGASFDHLHRQLVGLDEWGVQMEREITELRNNPNLYNEYAVNFAVYNSLLIAENDFAIALCEIGHRYPTISIYSKSEKSRPFEHSLEEITGMSDIVHAIHTVISSQTMCNEEWYYSPIDCIYSSPWHISIKLRVNTPAGFEGNTKIYINPISPQKLTKEIIEALKKKQDDSKINKNIKIGEDVRRTPNVLKYYKN